MTSLGDEARFRDAEAALAEFLDRVESGERLSFQEWRERRPEIAAELGRLYSEYLDLQEALGVDPLQRPERGDPMVEPPLEPIGRLESTGSLLERLQAGAHGRGEYLAKSRLGAGGMGEVFAVLDPVLRRELAMKVIREDPAAVDDSARRERRLARFLEEAQVMAQLDHPGIVPVHELGVDARGRPFLTMKRVRGRTLAQEFARLHARPSESSALTRCLAHLLRVCEAMAYAHERGVIHRDLKPTNVMLGNHGEVYVMDWGLARVLALSAVPPDDDGVGAALLTDRSESRGDGSGSSAHTRTGQGLGTAQYMPPEQAQGRWAEVDARADVFAIGAMLYHLLAGRAPYAEPPSTPAELRMRVVAGPPAALASLAPRAPAELVAVCERAMARDRSTRYASMSELGSELRAFLDGRVVHAYASGPWAEMRMWLRRNRRFALAVAGMLLSVGAALVLLLLSRIEARSRTEIERMAALLADKVRFDRLQDMSEDLWPPHPGLVPAMETWLASARILVGRNAIHRAALLQLESEEGNVATARSESWMHELATIHASLQSDGSLERYRSEMLRDLVAGLEGLEGGLIAEEGFASPFGWSLPRRMAFARGLESGFGQGGAHAQAWSEALPALLEAYPGLDWKPQMGLLPLGPDPQTGLWEFAHLMTGEPARRGSDRNLELTGETGLVLVLLPGGTSLIGAQSSEPLDPHYDPEAKDDECPVHEVELSPFFLSKYEMTQGQWLRLTAVEPSFHKSGDPRSWRYPVESVSWSQCSGWLPRAGLVIPTEAQWEYGVRAGATTPYWTGMQRASLAERRAANLADASTLKEGVEWNLEPGLDDGFAAHAPVGTFAANDFGLHDMTGNVWEWCRDGYDKGFYKVSPRLDPCSEADGAFVYRGGSFVSLAVAARSAFRLLAHAGYADATLGVRPARALDP